MNKKELQKIKNHYLELKEKLTKAVSNADIETDFDGDEVDEVQAKAITEVAKKLSQRQLLTLKKITFALQKIEKNDFGDCEECGNAILPKRLEAIPGVELCVECAEKQESSMKSTL